jgi:hypothetical protein
MFKLTLDQAAFEALEEGHKAFYKKDEKTGAYHLDLDPADIPDVEGLKRKNQELLDEKKAEQRRREEAERERAKKEGDITALETSWQTRLETETGTLKGENQKLATQLERLTVGRAATELAAELAVVTNGVSSAKALLPHIERRLSMETTSDGEVKVRVLDTAGKPSAMTLDQLKDEFRNDPVFAPLIAASKAGGSGADGGKNNGGGGATKKFADMNEAERTELHRKDPAEFKRQSEAHKATQQRQR